MIIFFIGCFDGINTGRGGHYYSLKSMAEALDLPYRIFVIGDFFPPAYEGAKDVVFFKLGRLEAYKFNPRTCYDLDLVTFVHAYDNSSAIFASKCASYSMAPLIVTKPGGPPLRNYSVIFENMVVFHGQDNDLLEERKFIKPKRLGLIPNRVSKNNIKYIERSKPFPENSENSIKILRIARIGPAYKDSIRQSIKLFERLENVTGEGGVYLSIVGYIEDRVVYEQLKSESRFSPNINFFNSTEYCVNSSELIQYADVVVGTGRSFMEAMSYCKYVFFPVSDSCLPCFATPESYEKAFYKNFSPRVSSVDGVQSEASFDEFLSLLDDSKKRKEYFCWLNNSFEKNHDVVYGAEKLRKFYNSVKENKSSYLSYLKYYFWSLSIVGLIFLTKRLYQRMNKII